MGCQAATHFPPFLLTLLVQDEGILNQFVHKFFLKSFVCACVLKTFRNKKFLKRILKKVTWERSGEEENLDAFKVERLDGSRESSRW